MRPAAASQAYLTQVSRDFKPHGRLGMAMLATNPDFMVHVVHPTNVSDRRVHCVHQSDAVHAHPVIRIMG